MDNELSRTDDVIAAIVERYADMVYKLALARTKDRHLAEDVFQEVFLRCVKKGGGFTSEEHLKAWLIRVTINCSRDLFRSSWFQKTEPLTDTLVFDQPEKGDVYYAMLELPSKYRVALHLFYYEGLKISEISRALKLPEGTVKPRLSRGRELLKEKLKGEYDYV